LCNFCLVLHLNQQKNESKIEDLIRQKDESLKKQKLLELKVQEQEMTISALKAEIDKKNEKFATMEKKIDDHAEDVEEALETWLKVVQKKIKKEEVVHFRKIQEEAEKQKKIENNVIMINVSEGGDDLTNAKKVVFAAHNLPENCNMLTKIVEVKRIGLPKEGKIRPLSVKFEKRNDALELVKRKRDLRKKPGYSRIYLDFEKTKEEMREYYKLVDEVRNRRKEGEYCYIYKNRICTKKQIVEPVTEAESIETGEGSGKERSSVDEKNGSNNDKDAGINDQSRSGGEERSGLSDNSFLSTQK